MTSDPQFEQCLAAYAAAQRTYSTYIEEVEKPADEAYQAAVANIPHLTTSKGYDAEGGPDWRMTTAGQTVAIARGILKDGDRPHDDDFYDCCREVVALEEERERQRRELRAERRDKVEVRADELCQLRYDAWQAVADYPVRSVSDLIRKVDLMTNGGTDDEYTLGELSIPTLLADLRRIAGEPA